MQMTEEDRASVAQVLDVIDRLRFEDLSFSHEVMWRNLRFDLHAIEEDER